MTEDSDEPFLAATYRALCRHGFADLTTQDIADETDRSKAALHYHYDGTEDLFRSFLDHLYEEYEATTASAPGETPAERLVGLVRVVLTPDDDGEQFTTAFLEIKAQAPYREGLGERMARFDRRTRDRVRDLVTDGIEAGQFPADTDPDAVAAFVTTHLHGVWTRSVVDGDRAAMRERLVSYVLDLLAPDVAIDRSVGLDEAAPDPSPDLPGADTEADPDAVASGPTEPDAETASPAEDGDGRGVE